MSKQNYVQVSRAFWKQRAFREVVEIGIEATAIALYVMTAPASNMTGLFECSVADIARHTGIGKDAVEHAIDALAKQGWLKYDIDAQVVWDQGTIQRQYGGKANSRQLVGLINNLVRLAEEESPFVNEAVSVLCDQYPGLSDLIREKVAELCYVRLGEV